MRVPLSLHTRIALLAIAMVMALFAINASAIVSMTEGVVADNLDTKLDAHLRILARSVNGRGQLDRSGFAGFPEIAAPPPGWGWEVRSAAGRWSQGLVPGKIEYPMPRIHPDDGIYSGRGWATSGQLVHVRRLDRKQGAGDVTVIVLSPRNLIDRELDRVRVEMLWLCGEIILVLVAIAALQVVIGLHPLRKLVKDLALVRAGDAHLVPDRQPPDIHPLAQEINALILRKDAALETARISAANLAHAVKTPLATLMLQLEHEKVSAEALQLITHVSDRVAHHLHRMRGASMAGQGRPRSDVLPVLRDVRVTMHMVHPARPLTIAIRGEEPCSAAIDGEDLHEVIGNLADNACRYAAAQVRLGAWADGPLVHIAVEDDGPGIPPEQQALVQQPGVRLDERTPGYGLGLAIVRELVELYAGHLVLGRSHDLGGLAAMVTLPR